MLCEHVTQAYIAEEPWLSTGNDDAKVRYEVVIKEVGWEVFEKFHGYRVHIASFLKIL